MRRLPEDSIVTDLVPGSTSLYFFFGGIQGALGMPPYEFYRAAQVLNANRVFVRDLAQAWYQRGLAGVGSSLEDIDAHLLSIIRRVDAAKIRWVGNSMGGFAALLFCARIGQGSATAFAPQSFISASLRAAHGDTRWPEQIARLHANLTGSEIMDLKSYLAKVRPSLPAQLYVARDDAMDMIHAGMLATFGNIVIHEVDTGGHELVKTLRDSGKLADILRA